MKHRSKHHYALTRREMHDAEATIHRASMQLRKKHESSLRMGHTLVGMAETGGTLFTIGLLNGRFGVFAPLGISVDLVAGLLLSLAGLFELGGERVAYHVTNIAEGTLGAFLMRKGVQLGTHWRVGANLPPLATFDQTPSLGSGLFGGEFARAHGGMPVPNSGRDLSDAELIAMQRAARG